MKKFWSWVKNEDTGQRTLMLEQALQQAQQQQNDPGHQGGNLQAGHAMLGDHPGQDNNESACGPSYLNPAATK